MKANLLSFLLLLAFSFSACKKPVDIVGCMDAKSKSYNPEATVPCDSCCVAMPEPISTAILGTYSGALTRIAVAPSRTPDTTTYLGKVAEIRKASDSSKVTLNLDFLRAKIATITNDGFVLPETYTHFTPQSAVTETGIATLNKKQLTVHIVQRNFVVSMHTSTYTWDGVLTKK
jgi:hypothetical protein